MTHRTLTRHVSGLAMFAALLLGGCSVTPTPTVDPTKLPADQQAIGAVVAASMDRKADPCQDFYQYACGGWIKATKRPEDHARWMRSFNVIAAENQAFMRTLLERPALKNERPQQIYHACRDQKSRDAKGLAPLKPYREVIAQVKDGATLMRALGTLHRDSFGGLFGFYVAADARSPKVYAAHLTQGGLGLWDRAYYTRKGDRAEKLRAHYKKHIARTLAHAGVPAAQTTARAEAVFALEHALAEKSWTRAQRRDASKTYNRRTADEVQKATGTLDWAAYFKALGITAPTAFVVGQPSFFEALAALAVSTPAAVWQDYLTWHLVRGASGMLDEKSGDLSFDFYGKILGGQTVRKPQWRRCVINTDRTLGQALGAQYVKERFKGSSKKQAQQLVKAVEEAFEKNLHSLAWMDTTTRKRAKEKLDTIYNKIGHPDVPRTYPGVKLTPDDHFANLIGVRRAERARRNGRVGKTVDPTEWYMSAPTVNAYYSAKTNQIVFPAGILQAPFFHESFPAAMNFGGIGMVIGHEITHGFDDQGRKFDKDGRLRMWWEAQTIKNFEERAQCVDKMYSSIEVQPGLFINGKMTLGENIADMGGLKLAFLAYQEWKETQPVKPSPVKGVSDNQLFFINFAQTWCAKATPEEERRRVRVDSHSPPRSRVNATVSTLPAFAQTFQCAPNTPMNPAKRCQVW